MDAIRKIFTVRGNTIEIEELATWQDREVELIILPAENRNPKKSAFGSMKGKIKMADDFDAPMDDFKEYMP
jgi:hypothetical protein